MKREELLRRRDGLRSRWRDVRGARLDLKKHLSGENMTPEAVRRDREYRKLKKEQKHISRMIKHIEEKLTRALVNEKR